MRVEELASSLNITSEMILTKLKALKLKAKDGKQELNAAVISVLRSEFKGVKASPPRVSPPPEPPKKEKAKESPEAKKKEKKTTAPEPIKETKIAKVKKEKVTEKEKKTSAAPAQVQEVKPAEKKKLPAKETQAEKPKIIEKPKPKTIISVLQRGGTGRL